MGRLLATSSFTPNMDNSKVKRAKYVFALFFILACGLAIAMLDVEIRLMPVQFRNGQTTLTGSHPTASFGNPANATIQRNASSKGTSSFKQLNSDTKNGELSILDGEKAATNNKNIEDLSDVPPSDATPTDNIQIQTATSQEDTTVGKLFLCGYPTATVLGQAIFPDYAENSMNWWDKNSPHPTANDVLLFSMHGDNACDRRAKTFPGKVLYANGEPHGDIHGARSNVYMIGNAGNTKQTTLVYFAAMTTLMRNYIPSVDIIFNPMQKPINTGKYKAVVYISSRCFGHRDTAFAAFSQIIEAHYGGKCDGKTNDGVPPKVENIHKMPEPPSMEHWVGVPKSYRNYQFCLVMDKKKQPYYISEKIVSAFLGGCVPIYSGTTEVFDVFNRNAFIYYDNDNPQAALDKVNYLVGNDTAYWEMVKTQPILANGNQTIRDYFSLSDDVGGGFLKQKIRTMMGLPQHANSVQ